MGNILTLPPLKVLRIGALAPALWSAPAERSGDGALPE